MNFISSLCFRGPRASWLYPFTKTPGFCPEQPWRAGAEDSETYCLASGEWFLTRQGDRVFQDGRELRIFGAGVEAAGAMAERSDPDFRWGTVPFSLAAGDRSTVTLRFNGPSLGEEMVLNTNSNMLLSEFWTINGQPLEAVEGTKGGLIVRLPPLPPGEHELAGSVQALCPFQGDRGDQGHLASRRFYTVDIERSWFDHEGFQSIRVKTTSPSFFPTARARVGGEGECSCGKGQTQCGDTLENPPRADLDRPSLRRKRAGTPSPWKTLQLIGSCPFLSGTGVCIGA